MKPRFKLILLAVFLFCSPSFLYSQEKLNTKVETKQGIQGRVQPQAAEPGFESSVKALSPSRIEFMEKMIKEQEKVLTPASPRVIQLPREKLTEKKTEKKEAVTQPESEPEEAQYYVDIGDVLDISVWQIPDLSRSEVIVRPDGKISFPLIGDIKAKGLNFPQLADIITEKLKLYVKTPQVSIMIRSFGEQANKVIVLGEIPSPGIYKFSSNPTISDAIASAGGYTKYAVLNSIMIIRGGVKLKQEVVKVNFAQILKSGKLSENIFLKSNDIVYVPRSFIGNVNTFLEIMQPAIAEYLQTLNARQLQSALRRKGGI